MPQILTLGAGKGSAMLGKVTIFFLTFDRVRILGPVYSAPF
jgi:hypothetical protein